MRGGQANPFKLTVSTTPRKNPMIRGNSAHHQEKQHHKRRLYTGGMMGYREGCGVTQRENVC